MSRLFVGIVKNGLFKLLFPQPEKLTQLRLTSAAMQDSVAPENGEHNLIEYENTAIAVEGYCNGGWIYSASVVDTGEPIVTTLVETVFGQ
jgi:hypothetical protein